MSEMEVQEFVTRFAAAWAARDGALFAELWHRDGALHYPLVERTLAGSEIGVLNEAQNAAAPDLVWQLLDWTWRRDTVVVEWQATRFAGGHRFSWRGVDKLRIVDGKIAEERVYMDTAPLRAARSGETLEPLLRL